MTRRPFRSFAADCVALLIFALCTLGLAAGTAAAHPHVWVKARSTVLYENGAVTGFHHVWTFDDMYSAMAIEGLDKNGDGKFDRGELAELAKVNVDGLKDFDYFTYPKLGEAALEVLPPKSFWLDYKNKVLELNFILPLAKPVLADAKGLSFAVIDPSYFIAFEFMKDNPVTIGKSAPAGCQAVLADPGPQAAIANDLNAAFAGQLGGDLASPPPAPTTVQLSCAPKS